jgi:hypothetical protein
MAPVSCLDEMPELGAHHRGTADRPAQHGLVHDRPDPGRIRPAEQVLALEAQGDPTFDLVGGRGLAPEAGDGPRVVLGLEQPVPELDLEAADGRRSGALDCPTSARNFDRRTSSVTPYKVSRSVISRLLSLTLPSSSRLILDWDARISYPACSGVMPAASRRRRSRLPSSMRSTVASTEESSRPDNGCSPLGPTVLTTRSNADGPARVPASADPVPAAFCHTGFAAWQAMPHTLDPRIPVRLQNCLTASELRCHGPAQVDETNQHERRA